MTRFPNIRIQGWHHDGPVYQIERPLDGWRNRKARRAGEADHEQVGHPGGRNVTEPAAFMVFVKGDDELYAFNEGHVYEVEQLVDGEASIIHVDAREDHVLHAFTNGIQLLGWRGLEDDELEALLEPGEQAPVEAASDPSESQDPAGGALTVTDLSGPEPVAGQNLYRESAGVLRSDEALVVTDTYKEHFETPEAKVEAPEVKAEEAISVTSEHEVPEPGPVADQEADERVASMLTDDEFRELVAAELDVPVEELAEFDAEQLEDLRSSSDDEDAVIGGEDSGKSATEEE